MKSTYKNGVFRDAMFIKDVMLRSKIRLIFVALLAAGAVNVGANYIRTQRLATILKASPWQRNSALLKNVPRHSAAHAKALESLIDSQEVDVKDPVQATHVADVLISFIRTHRENLVEKMLDKGANPSLPNDRGEYPIIVAAGEGTDQIVGLLVKAGADPDFVDPYGYNALSAAARDKRKNILKYLLKIGATKNLNRMGSSDMTPLEYAYYWTQEMGDAPDVSGLLIQAGALTSYQIRTHQAALAQIQTGQKVHQ